MAVGSSATNVQGIMPTINTYPGSTVAAWETAEAFVTTIGGAGTINKVHSLLLDINALVGNVTMRLYIEINGVQRQSYSEVFTVAVDGPGLWIINGSLAIHDLLWVSAQSDDPADNAQAIGWQYILEAT